MNNLYRISTWKPTRAVRPEGNSPAKDLFAIRIEYKYQFVNEAGQILHEYHLPNNQDIVTAGGYIGKVFIYRDPHLLRYFSDVGIRTESFETPRFPILATRSPQLDLTLWQLIQYLRKLCPGRKLSLLDHGCTVAEHYDLLDVLARAASDGRESASNLLSYTGLDNSAYLINVAHSLHAGLPQDSFRLLLQEGTALDFKSEEFDLSLSVGVVNHVFDPLLGLDRIVNATRHAVVLALWTTSEEQGFWTTNHAGWPFYFFSRKDLLQFQNGNRRWYSTRYVPESQASQPDSYIGLSEERFNTIGEHHLVLSSLEDLGTIFGWGKVL